MSNFKRSSLSPLLVICTALFAGSALAQDTDKKMSCGKKAYMDADGDGVVTREEFMQGHEKMFERIDQNSDGVLDESERMAHHKHKKGKMMKGDCPMGGMGQGKGQGMGRGAE